MNQMNIAIIGTGRVGRVLGRRWAKAGHAITFGSRRFEDESVQALANEAGARVALPEAAAGGADLVVLAVPGTQAEAVVKSLGDLSGKTLIDCTNPMGPGREARPELSAAEEIAALVPEANIVKAFNTTGSKNMENPVYPEGRLMMPFCGDDATAKAQVRELIAELDFEPFDNGPLSQARALEAMAFMWIHQAFSQQWGPDFGFALLRR